MASIAAALMLLSMSGAAQAQDAAQAAAQLALPNVMDVRVTVTPDRARLVVDLAARTEFSFVSLTSSLSLTMITVC